MSDSPQGQGSDRPDPRNPYAPGGQSQPAPGQYPQPGAGQAPGYPQAPPPQEPPYGAPGVAGGYPQAPTGYPGQTPYDRTPYGQMPPQVSMGDAFKYGWDKFSSNAGVVIGGFLVWSAIVAAVTLAMAFALFGSIALGVSGDNDGLAVIGVSSTTLLFIPVILVLSYLAQAAAINVAAVASSGRQVRFRDFFSFPKLGTVLLLCLVIGAASGLLSGLTLGIGSLAVGLFSQFMLFFAIDQRMGFVAAFRSGWDLVVKNFTPAILLYLIVLACEFVGSLLCIVGLIVAVPMAMFISAYVYRRLLGQQPA